MEKLNGGRRIAVVGAGAIGSLIGALLARAGNDVTLVGKAQHVEAINREGLSVRGAAGDFSIRIRAVTMLDFHPDVVLLAMKTQDLQNSCTALADLARGAILVSLQNGVASDEILASFFPKSDILSVVVMLNAQYLEAGKVFYPAEGALMIGAPFAEAQGRVSETRRLLSRAVATKAGKNIAGAHWAKLLVNNFANGMEASTGKAISECMEDPKLKMLAARTFKEGYWVARNSGIRFASIPNLPRPLLTLLGKAPAALTGMLLARAAASSNSLSSTLQSIKRGRPTEIDWLNGEIARRASALGMRAPCNEAIVQAVHQVEAGGLPLSAEKLWELVLEKEGR